MHTLHTPTIDGCNTHDHPSSYGGRKVGGGGGGGGEGMRVTGILTVTQSHGDESVKH